MCLVSVAVGKDNYGHGFLVQRKKSEFEVKRNLFEKPFAYQQKGAGIEHKISDFVRKRNSSTPRLLQLEVILP
ncbi:MAG: hypothetical protein WAK60_02110 [Sedimentisphaerales bacterium]